MRAQSLALTLSAALVGAVLLPAQGSADPEQLGKPSGPPITFVNVAPQLGLNYPSLGRGAAMVDLDGDDLLDIVCANTGTNNAFFKQFPDGSFRYWNVPWGIQYAERNSFCVLAADFDNDGDNDIYFPNGGWSGLQRNTMLRNDLDTTGQFTDISPSTGDAGNMFLKSFGCTALDYDHDGLLDIFVSNQKADSAIPTCTLLRNEGGLYFRDVSQQAGIIHLGAYTHCTAGDINNDGWDDVGVGTKLGFNRLYVNNGDGTFRDIAREQGFALPDDAFGMVIEDFDNDGWMDIWLPRYQFSGDEPSKIFMNNGDGTFREETAGSGLTRQTDMGHNTGDLDADGYPDIYIGTGSPIAAEDDLLHRITPNGKGGVNAPNIAFLSGLLSEGPSRQHGVAFGDYDQDGDLDIYNNNGGPEWIPSSWGENTLWQSQGNENHWVKLDLEGILSNRTAVGARSVAVLTNGREVHRRLTVGKGFGNTDDHTQHFGLGLDKEIDYFRVNWPSGIQQWMLDPIAYTRSKMLETGVLLTNVPTVGGRIELDICGEAGYEATIFYSFDVDEIRKPDMGGFQFLKDPLFTLDTVTIDGDGRKSVSYPVPDQKSLRGQTVYTQVWVREPGATTGGILTNRVAATIQ